MDLVTGARPFKSARYRAEPKESELKEFEIKSPLTDGVTECSKA